MPTSKSQISRLNDTEMLLKSSFRTMAIFEFFADIQRPASIGEISKALKIPQSSTSSIVGSLVDTGYLTKDSHSRTFTPSMRLNYLNAWRGERHPFAAQFSHHLKSLHEDSGETAVLAMRNGIYSHYILVQHSHDILREHVGTGSVRPLACSATGWSLLAHESDKEIEKLINRTRLSIQNPRWIEACNRTKEHIKNVRQTGFAWSDGEASNGASGIAMSVLNPGSNLRLSIALAGPTQRMNSQKERLLNLLANFVEDLPNNFTNHVLGAENSK